MSKWADVLSNKDDHRTGYEIYNAMTEVERKEFLEYIQVNYGVSKECFDYTLDALSLPGKFGDPLGEIVNSAKMSQYAFDARLPEPDYKDKWDNIKKDEDGITNAAHQAIWMGSMLHDMPKEIMGDQTLISAYKLGLENAKNDALHGIADMRTDASLEGSPHHSHMMDKLHNDAQRAEQLIKSASEAIASLAEPLVCTYRGQLTNFTAEFVNSEQNGFGNLVHCIKSNLYGDTAINITGPSVGDTKSDFKMEIISNKLADSSTPSWKLDTKDISVDTIAEAFKHISMSAMNAGDKVVIQLPQDLVKGIHDHAFNSWLGAKTFSAKEHSLEHKNDY
ncbi:hypothetical protein ACLHZ0_20090 [Aeromonas salmonicida]|uniref:hypothetical protein n=1 Tax=Aeromonas salmonicida TaxID=645 RepID=UPI003D05DA03